jgi:hypothetical protein
VIALSVCALQAQAQAFHVHRVPDHDDASRHAHAAAIHHHDTVSHGDLRLIEHDETVDTITLTVPAATAFDALIAVCVSATVLSFELPELSGRLPSIEVRSHGPPCLRQPSFRGPPSFTSA